MTSMDRFLRIRQAYGASFCVQRRDVVFLMNLTGTAQIFSVAETGGWPDLVVEMDDRVTFVRSSPVGEGLVFGMDQGGNERDGLFFLENREKDPVALLVEPGVICRFGAFSSDGGRIAYSANRRNGRDFDVYLQSLLPVKAPELGVTLSGSWRVAGFCPGDDALLLIEELATDRQCLYTWDLTTGRMQLITPEEALYREPAYDAAGNMVVLTNRGRQWVGVAARTEDGLWRWLYTPPWDCEHLAVSQEGWLAVDVNQEGYSVLHLIQPLTGSDQVVSGFGPGVIDGLSFSPDGRWLLATFHGPDENMNVWMISVWEAAARPLTNAPRAGLDTRRFVRPSLHKSPSFDALSIPVWVYLPKGEMDRPAPVVISVHGGPESQERPGFNAFYQLLTDRGYAVVAPNVRGSTGYGKDYQHLDDKDLRMNAIRDLEAILALISQMPALDDERVALYGGSYGGYMVLSGLTWYPDRFRAGIDIVGMANLETFLERTGPWRRHLREAEYGYLDRDRDLLKALSPIHRVEQIKAPLLVVHGRNDPRVPWQEADQIVSALKERGRTVEALYFDNEGHGVARLENRRLLYARILDFLARYVPVTSPRS